MTPGDHYVAPGNEIEKRLAGIWSEVLNIPAIGIDDNFFELGGHSLKATILNSRIYKELHVNIPLGAIFQNPNIRALAALISGSGAAVFQHIPRGEEREYYPLSYNQSRLFILHRMKPGSPTFHMHGYVDLRHEVDVNVVKRVLERIISRHESFRTAFVMVEDYPYQVISTEVETPFEFFDLSVMDMDPLEKKKKCDEVFRRITVDVFDLFSAPLFRAALVKLELHHYRLIFNMHHIVSDGWSMEILKREFSQLYEGYRLGQEKKFPALSAQYKDFALWQNRQIENREGEISLEFWQKKIEQGLPVFQMRKDSQESIGSTESAGYRFTLEKEDKDKLKQIAAANNTSIFVVMYAILNLLLYRLSGQEDVVTCILGAGRQHESLQHILGFFVNTLIMKNHVAENEAFILFLRRLNQDLLEILQHQDYPLELVFEHLDMKFPEIPLLFNMFSLNESALQQKLEASELEPYHIANVQDAKFEMVIFVAEYKNAVQVDCQYWKAVYKKERIHYMMQKYLGVLKAVAADPSRPIKQYLFKEKAKKRKVELVRMEE
jgi:iturin family lipopeptide synthetase B